MFTQTQNYACSEALYAYELCLLTLSFNFLMFSCKLYSYTYITYTFPATHLQDTLLICITAMDMLIMIVYFVINFKECMLTCGSWSAPNSNYILAHNGVHICHAI